MTHCWLRSLPSQRPHAAIQRAVAAQTGMSVGEANEAVSNLTEYRDRHITDEGLDALSPIA